MVRVILVQWMVISAAAMRYTEAKLSVISSFLVNDIDNETVSFRENYDGTSAEEPVVITS